MANEETNHVYKNRHLALEHARQRLRNDIGIVQKDREYLEQWVEHLSISGAKGLRIGKLIIQGLLMAHYSPNGLADALKTDIIKMQLAIESQKQWAENTKADYRRWIRQFYNWFEAQDTRLKSKNLKSDDKSIRDYAIDQQEAAQELYTYVKKGLKVGYHIKDIDPSEIITEQDLMILIDKGCVVQQERAITSVIHQGGFRTGEFLNIKIKDVTLRDAGADIYVNGKTGPRTVPIMFATDLLRYIENHPYKNNPESYLWIAEDKKHAGLPLSYMGLTRIVREIFERAGVKKKHNLHWTRHSRASIIAQYMTEVILCKFMGWRVGSKMARIYCHGDSTQVREVQAKHFNLQSEKEKIVSVICPSCRFVNEADKRYCGRCGRALTVSIALEDENKKTDAINEAMELFSKIMQDPGMRKKFEEYKDKNMGVTK